MRVRIIAGQFGGRFIESPATDRTHPMGERMRGALFNILGDLEGQVVCDAFAGTGAVGLEAVSRGAHMVTMIERDRAAQKVIAQNTTTLQCAAQVRLVATSVAAWTDTTPVGPMFDLIIADPPYHDLQLGSVAKLASYLKPNGLMVLSYPGRESAPTVNGVVVVDKRSYGDAALAFYRLVT